MRIETWLLNFMSHMYRFWRDDFSLARVFSSLSISSFLSLYSVDLTSKAASTSSKESDDSETVLKRIDVRNVVTDRGRWWGRDLRDDLFGFLNFCRQKIGAVCDGNSCGLLICGSEETLKFCLTLLFLCLCNHKSKIQSFNYVERLWHLPAASPNRPSILKFSVVGRLRSPLLQPPYRSRCWSPSDNKNQATVKKPNKWPANVLNYLFLSDFVGLLLNILFDQSKLLPLIIDGYLCLLDLIHH